MSIVVKATVLSRRWRKGFPIRGIVIRFTATGATLLGSVEPGPIDVSQSECHRVRDRGVLVFR
jgi:hypothetical protein